MSLSPSLLRPGVAHLFLAHPETLLAAVPGHAQWLSAAEKEHAERFRRLGDGARYRATRVLVRGILSGLLARPPGRLDFEEGPHGRPALRAGVGRVDFNASRSRAWVALVVTAGAACGVDVEDLSRQADVLGIARAFAPSERAVLEAAQGEERRRTFFALWTLKEATLKALGTGLTLPLSACAFHLEPEKPPRVTFGGVLAEDPKEWSFAQIAPDAGSLLAVAVRRAEPPEFILHAEAETCAAVAALV